MAASKLLPSTILIFSLFLISLPTFSSACNCSGSPLPPVHKPPPAVPKSPPPVPKSPPPSSPPPIPKSPPPKSPPPTPKSPPPKSPSPVPKSPPPCSPPPTPKSPPASIPPPSPPKTPAKPPPACPINTLKLGACANLLGHSIVIGAPVSKPCCTVLSGLTDLQAALCLCTAIKADVLGIHLNVPVTLSVILNDCGKSAPPGFKCA